MQRVNKRRVIILDRDGVINKDSKLYIKSLREWQPIAGSLEAIARLYHAGFTIVVASNQSGLGRGYFGIDTVNAIHQELQLQLQRFGARIDAFFFCPHVPDAHCACRKPLPGLLQEVALRLGISMHGILVVGDSMRDIEAAISAGASPMLVRTGNGQQTSTRLPNALSDVPVYDDLSSAANSLLSEIHSVK